MLKGDIIMGLPNKVRFGLAADSGVLHLSQGAETEPHYRMELNGCVDQNDLIRMAKHLSAEGILPILFANSILSPQKEDYKYPLSGIQGNAFTEALTAIKSVSVPSEETDNLLAHDHCTPL